MHFPSILIKSASWVTLQARRWAVRHTDSNSKKSVLIIGVYLADRENAIQHIVHALGESHLFVVDQKWISLFGEPPSEEVASVTVKRQFGRVPKFTLMNYLLATTAWRLYDYVIICDDDIQLPPAFIDRFLSLQERFGFALAQPARTHNSYIDHPITEQSDDLLARETRFVEIGPLTSIRADMMHLIAPFDERAPMGWGLDFVWPYIAGQKGLPIGIVDATPVDHSMRPPVSSYDGTSTRTRMQSFLNANAHLEKDDAFVVVNSYPVENDEQSI